MIGPFIGVGFGHIVSRDALDHILFLAVLAASYRMRDWRHGLIVASAFTIGHSVTLALVSLEMLSPPSAIVEFLIPCTIVVAAAENLLHRGSRPSGVGRPMLAGAFGLVHGAGFAGTLRDLFDGSVVLPLLGFNIGIELGQVLVLLVMVAILSGVDGALVHLGAAAPRAVRLRARFASVSIAAVAAIIAAQRLPW